MVFGLNNWIQDVSTDIAFYIIDSGRALELEFNVLKSSDASAKSFTTPSQRIWGEGRKYRMIMGRTLW